MGNPNAANLTLSTTQRSVLNGVFAENGQQVSVRDSGQAGAGKVSAGDTVEIKNAQGVVVSTKVLTEQDAYNVNFRTNLISAADKASEPAWDFTESIVEMPKSKLNPAQARSVVENGQTINEKVLGRNDFWEVVERRGSDGKPFSFLKMRSEDAQGNPIK
ncbi:MAG: hypothetical protein J5W83_09530, partial [Candidatus Accumulibacter sp.]|nr:hypothetical protein [Accumulibacter sp.]